MMRRVPWWISEIVYQIYPKSFCDSNGDGIGDLAGITQKLDYLKELGTTMIWLSPCFQSPMVDNGYDISDYRMIAPEFGTMEDMDRLIREAGDRGIKIMLDLVVNHSSDEHEWFRKALSDPFYHDYYIFKESDHIPNNWRSIFGGTVWEKVPGREEYYYHTFHRKQPDLNWENPSLRREIISIVRWWLDRGVAGFRVDAITFLKKEDYAFQPEPDGVDGRASLTGFGYDVDGIGAFLRELREEGFDYKPCLTVAEAYGVKEEHFNDYIGDQGYFDLMFDFEAADLDYEGDWLHPTHWTIREWKDKLMNYQMKIQPYGWCATFIENHDQPRAASKYLGDHARDPEAVKTLGAMYFFLRGVPFIYQGQELGMVNFCRERIDQFDDLSSHDMWQRGLEEGLPEEKIMKLVNRRSRDQGRTPFPWNGEEHGGFTEGEPWLELTQEYPDINAASQEEDPDSILSFYKEMIAFRQHGKWSDCFKYGSISPMESNDQVIAYIREYEDTRLYCWFSFADESQEIELPEGCSDDSWHTGEKLCIEKGRLTLLARQSVILRQYKH
ncbi:MAG: alpha-glucosidase [Eubacterium sp.]|nr:alpha-glucosidase [Eubacterium sp.]